MSGFWRPFVAMRRDPRWLSKVAVGVLVNLIPYIGTFVVMGWALEYLRRVAWGSDEVLPEWSDLAAHLERGFFGFLVMLPWSFAIGLVVSILTAVIVVVGAVAIAGVTSLAGFIEEMPEEVVIVTGLAFGPAVLALTLAASYLLIPPMYAALARYAVYDRLDAGFKFREIWEAMKSRQAPLLRAWGHTIALSAAIMVPVFFSITAAVSSPLLAAVVGERFGDGAALFAMAGSWVLYLVMYAVTAVLGVVASIAYYHWWGGFARAAYLEPAG